MIISIITTVIFLNAIIYSCYQVFVETTDEKVTEEHTISKKTLGKVFCISLLVRVLFLLGGMLFLYYTFHPAKITWSFFTDFFCRGDSFRYCQIAKYGYTNIASLENDISNICFFPLYPWLMRGLGFIIGNVELAGYVISFLSFCVAMVLMYIIVCEDYGEDMAKRSIAILILSPFSIFFGCVMTESLFLMLVLATWLMIKRKRWLWAGVLGLLTTLTRNLGVLLVIPYAIVLFKQYRESLSKKIDFTIIKKMWKDGKWVLLIPLGMLIYLGINYYYFGDCFQFVKFEQSVWNHQFCYFGMGTDTLIRQAFDKRMPFGILLVRFIPTAVYIVIFNLLMVFSLKKHKSEYLLFSIAYFIICASDRWQLSFTRYLTALFPAYIFVAKELEKEKVLYYAILVSEAFLEIALSILQVCDLAVY